jgi:formylglycine-generating enzyme required for sulfatase activity
MKTALNAKEQQLPHHDMIWVEGGTFLMGSPENAPESFHHEKPAHKVGLSDFYIGRYPVTQALWEFVMGDNPAFYKGSRRPVEQVSWYDAVVFCNRLSIYAGRPPLLFFG